MNLRYFPHIYNSSLATKQGHHGPKMSSIQELRCTFILPSACAWRVDPYIIYILAWGAMTKPSFFFFFSFFPVWQIFPGLILSDIKPAKKMKFKTVCYLLVQLMHCRKMFKAEIPFSNVMNCEDGDKVETVSAPWKGANWFVCTSAEVPVKLKLGWPYVPEGKLCDLAAVWVGDSCFNPNLCVCVCVVCVKQCAF